MYGLALAFKENIVYNKVDTDSRPLSGLFCPEADPSAVRVKAYRNQNCNLARMG